MPTAAPAKPRSGSRLADRLAAAGIVAPRTAIRQARRAGLPLELACALLEKESSGGRNVYGHDPTIFVGAGRVTRTNYAEYRRRRVASGNRLMQGVGPCQLTWWEFQDAADAQGGCWRPAINMRVGFSHLAELIKRYGASEGARRYNGSGPAAEVYSRDLMVRARRWESIIAAAREREPSRPQEPARRRRPARERVRPEAPSRLEALTRGLRRHDDEAEHAWRSLVAYGHRHRRRLLASRAAAEAGDGASPEGLEQLLAALARIEGRLGTLVEVTMHRPEPVAGAEAPAAEAESAPAPPAAEERPLAKATVPELVREVEALGERRRQLQQELIERYQRVDEQLARLGGAHAAGNGAAPARPARRPERARPASGSERDPLGGKSVDTNLGDRGVVVRRSKIALSRYLAQHGSAEHAALRRRLRREAATPRTGGIASAAWLRAVQAVQQLAGRPVTGELDGDLVQLLLPYWPRDHIVKRMVRSTPAWRAIPGQLTPNFNIKEFACKDAARTSYVSGLMREQGLDKKAARARAKGLANRLEHVRRLGGSRPVVITSAFRTRAYNASLTGSATNSAHTRGFAADMPPPRGVSLDQHRRHVLEAFECGVGYYPKGRGYFVHGDFDTTLGGRRVW